MTDGEGVHRQHQISGSRAGNAGDVQQPVVRPIELLEGSVDASGIGQVDFDVTVDGGSGGVSVQRGHFGTCGEQPLCDGVADAGRGTGDHEALSLEGRHFYS